MRENVIQVDYTQMRAAVFDMKGAKSPDAQAWVVRNADPSHVTGHDTEAVRYLLQAAWCAGYQSGSHGV